MPLSSIYPQNNYRQQPVYQQQMPGMSLNMPLGMLQPPQQSNDGIIGLHGLDSARQYPMRPNTTVPTFDLDSDHAFILNADANGVVSVKILKFNVISEEEYRKDTESELPVQIAKGDYDKLLDRVDKLEEELNDAKQFIRSRTATADDANTARTNSAKYTGKSAASAG